jgi:hypothetical protein
MMPANRSTIDDKIVIKNTSISSFIALTNETSENILIIPI